MKKVLITAGDPAGIGPFITITALKDLLSKKIDFKIIGTESILGKIKGFSKIANKIELIEVKTKYSGRIKKGYPNRYSGQLALQYLEVAVDFLKKEKGFSLVTAPVSKEAIKLIKPDFQGHTEYLAKKFKVKNFSMFMVGNKLRIVILTRHIPLRKVPEALNYRDLYQNINLLFVNLKKLFKLKKVKIALCGLNPHAGINTFLEREEKLLVRVKKKFKNKNLELVGPYPADTIFREALNNNFSAILALYHDQGMIPFKTLEFSQGVNLTLGLPFIRTSPAHGPAFDLVDKPNLINSQPMQKAVKLALSLSCNEA
ncbi:MAG TPA: 4-hydroxythreonine-4-phosphate dehydrogenase [Candidatus Omnitrophica bacterium]|nr:MAG: 4-hydroxythreonine-4-phosphate dehydrogenase [Candidatus Omnitrophota bacterium]RKY44308.1 MAG: 4-hydroxythreonine-4-phosphate dehydrogenase [Candidatus Omnitrophota bacterium]HEC68788.1 4-hydroxythreonine-4-phosphate dehydrogenase [Candidatus Omnitrophota bacterium]